MKKVIALISTAIVLGLMVLTFFKGPAYQGGKAGHIIEDLKALEQKAKIEPIKEKDVGAEKLKALRDKAGNTSSFEVSDASGTQNGKKLMGPGLIGQSEDKLLKDLVDFKAGRKENFIMKGLLMNLSEEDLKSFAKEISQFEARKNALK
jgi:hypothetical protein